MVIFGAERKDFVIVERVVLVYHCFDEEEWNHNLHQKYQHDQSHERNPTLHVYVLVVHQPVIDPVIEFPVVTGPQRYILKPKDLEDAQVRIDLLLSASTNDRSNARKSE